MHHQQLTFCCFHHQPPTCQTHRQSPKMKHKTPTLSSRSRQHVKSSANQSRPEDGPGAPPATRSARQQPRASSPAPPTQALRALAQTSRTHFYLQPRPPLSAPGPQTRGSFGRQHRRLAGASLSPSKQQDPPPNISPSKCGSLRSPARMSQLKPDRGTPKTLSTSWVGPHNSPTTTVLLAPTCRGTRSQPSPCETRGSRLAPGSLRRPPGRASCSSTAEQPVQAALLLEKALKQPRPTYMPQASKSNDQTLSAPACPLTPTHCARHWRSRPQALPPAPLFESQSKLAASVVRSFQAILVIPTPSCWGHSTLPRHSVGVTSNTSVSTHFLSTSAHVSSPKMQKQCRTQTHTQ